MRICQRGKKRTRPYIVPSFSLFFLKNFEYIVSYGVKHRWQCTVFFLFFLPLYVPEALIYMFKPVHSFKVLVVLEYTVDAAAVNLQIERVVVVTAVLEEEYILS